MQLMRSQLSDVRAMRDLTLILTLTAVFLLLLVLGFGYALGRSEAATDCRHLGAFTFKGKVYECKPRF
jgi:hypothetical protein